MFSTSFIVLGISTLSTFVGASTLGSRATITCTASRTINQKPFNGYSVICPGRGTVTSSCNGGSSTCPLGTTTCKYTCTTDSIGYAVVSLQQSGTTNATTCPVCPGLIPNGKVVFPPGFPFNTTTGTNTTTTNTTTTNNTTTNNTTTNNTTTNNTTTNNTTTNNTTSP